MLKKYSYKAFTLIEMLIVMTIFIALFAITISAFSGLRTSILMNQTQETVKQNFRWAQRAAIMLKRDPGENWLYGIGIDLSTIYQENGTYRIFKWCTPYREYSDDFHTQGKFPNYEDGSGADIANGESANIPFSNTYNPPGTPLSIYGPRYVDNCADAMGGIFDPAGALAEIKSTGTGQVDDFTIPAPLILGYKSENTPRFIVYEAVSGNVFFYDYEGYLMNYIGSDDNFSFVDDPIHLDFVISTPNKNRGINLTLNARSGKLFTDSIDTDGLNGYNFTVGLFVPVFIEEENVEPVIPPGVEEPVLPPGAGDPVDPPEEWEEEPFEPGGGYDGGDDLPIDLPIEL